MEWRARVQLACDESRTFCIHSYTTPHVKEIPYGRHPSSPLHLRLPYPEGLTFDKISRYWASRVDKNIKERYRLLTSNMFAKLKAAGASISSSSGSSILSTNPILQYFDVGPQVCTAGPELAWKVFQATRKSDSKVRFLI